MAPRSAIPNNQRRIMVIPSKKCMPPVVDLWIKPALQKSRWKNCDEEQRSRHPVPTDEHEWQEAWLEFLERWVKRLVPAMFEQPETRPRDSSDCVDITL
jgi:hypothetical protein